MLQQPTVIVPKRQKSKRPSKSTGPTSPQEGTEANATGGSVRRKPSVKRSNNNNNNNNNNKKVGSSKPSTTQEA